MDIIDLRDIVDQKDENEEQYNTWKAALDKDAGYDIEELAENEPTMIADDDFEDYARELAEECGMIKDDVSWPMTCIDWTEAAEELQQDYSQVEVDGTTYWFRSY